MLAFGMIGTLHFGAGALLGEDGTGLTSLLHLLGWGTSFHFSFGEACMENRHRHRNLGSGDHRAPYLRSLYYLIIKS